MEDEFVDKVLETVEKQEINQTLDLQNFIENKFLWIKSLNDTKLEKFNIMKNREHLLNLTMENISNITKINPDLDQYLTLLIEKYYSDFKNIDIRDNTKKSELFTNYLNAVETAVNQEYPNKTELQGD